MLWNRSPRACTKAALTLALACTSLWLWLGRLWCKITLSLEERTMFSAHMSLTLKSLCSINGEVDDSLHYLKRQRVEASMLYNGLFWTNFENKSSIEFKIFHTRTDGEDSPQFSLPSTYATLFHIKTGKHHLLDKSQVFDNEEGKYHLLSVYWMSGTELGLKLSFGESLTNCIGFKCKKQQKGMKQNKWWISSRLNF